MVKPLVPLGSDWKKGTWLTSIRQPGPVPGVSLNWRAGPAQGYCNVCGRLTQTSGLSMIKDCWVPESQSDCPAPSLSSGQTIKPLPSGCCGLSTAPTDGLVAPDSAA